MSSFHTMINNIDSTYVLYYIEHVLIELLCFTTSKFTHKFCELELLRLRVVFSLFLNQ